MNCEHHWHDEGIWEFCCECNAHKCETIDRVREYARILNVYPNATYSAGFIAKKILDALDGEQ